jgi:hypothetical protein
VSCGAKPVQGTRFSGPGDVALPFLSESRLHVRRRCGEVEKTDGCRWFSVGRGVSPFASCFRRRKLLKKERRTRERKWSATHSPISRPSRAGNSSNGYAVRRPGCLARCMRFRWRTDPQIVPIPSLTVNFSLAGISRWALCSTWFPRQGLQAHVATPMSPMSAHMSPMPVKSRPLGEALPCIARGPTPAAETLRLCQICLD